MNELASWRLITVRHSIGDQVLLTKVIMSDQEVDELFNHTLIGGYDDDEPWSAVHTLRSNSSLAIFNRAKEWCRSSNPLKRVRAADILCQLRHVSLTNDSLTKSDPMFREESYLLVTEMLATEQDLQALSSEISALGHLDNPEAVPKIVRYADHPDENVRFSVAFALGCFPNDPTAVSHLLLLTSDVDSDVRDWAIFGLGVQGDADSAEIRERFLDCLNDPFLDARMEAAAALGKRHDARVAPALIGMLKENGSLRGLVEAAQYLLELSDDPPDWFEAEYIAALESRFPEAVQKN